MRIGTTSYIYPADIVTNVRKLAGSVDDIELVLFEVNDPVRDLPDKGLVKELREIASHNNFSYTVHLPLDLGLAGNQPKLDLAQRVIASTWDIDPYAFIIHLDHGDWTGSNSLESWTENSINSLYSIRNLTGVFDKLCIENLEDQPSNLIDSILELIPVSVCVDIGHLWKQGLDPLTYLKSWLPRMRVAHIHGVGQRDHRNLAIMPESKLFPVTSFLCNNFDGVVTIEVFNQSDLAESLHVLRKLVMR